MPKECLYGLILLFSCLTLSCSKQNPVSNSADSPPSPVTLPTVTANDPIPTETSPLILSTYEAPTEQPIICSQSPMEFDIEAILEIRPVAHMDFLAEDTIMVDGWRSAAFPRYIAGQIDLTRQQVNSLESDLTPISRPIGCDTDCTLEAFSQSPDGHWQLVLRGTIADNHFQAEVLLIGSYGERVELVDFIPYQIEWEWAEDSSLSN